MNKKFIYDEKSSNLYSPDGTFLKKVFCPKAIRWNQLIVEEAEDRWRGCSSCKEKVLNLDVVDTLFILKNLEAEFSNVCIHASSNSDNVIFLKDPDEIPKASTLLNYDGELIIHTARSFDDIERAVGMGYWPDIRLVNYDTENIKSKVSIGQNSETGHIKQSGDYRRPFKLHSYLIYGDDHAEIKELNNWKEVIPFTDFYPNYQATPIAAYLIPNGIPDNTKVIVKDPIEDIVGGRWNQGGSSRAVDVPGYIKDKKIILEPENIEVSSFVG